MTRVLWIVCSLVIVWNSRSRRVGNIHSKQPNLENKRHCVIFIRPSCHTKNISNHNNPITGDTNKHETILSDLHSHIFQSTGRETMDTMEAFAHDVSLSGLPSHLGFYRGYRYQRQISIELRAILASESWVMCRELKAWQPSSKGCIQTRC